MAGSLGSQRRPQTVVRSASAKEASWRERLRRFRRAGQTVAEFCAAEGISTASFYQWRRRLGERRPPKPDAPGRTSAFQAVRVKAVVSAISVHLPGGARIDVPAEQLDALVAVMAELRRGSFAASTEGSSC